MTDSESLPINKFGRDNEAETKGNELVLDLSQLPKAAGSTKNGVTLYQGCWFPTHFLQNTVSFQQKFNAHDQDIVLVSYPKSGTTWLKSIAFSILNRHRCTPSNSPLLTSNPHDLVPFFEFTLFSDPPLHDLRSITSPRLLATHIPYASLPSEILGNAGSHGPRIVYVSRNPLDMIVSFWHFIDGHPLKHAQWMIENCVEAFCKGESDFGPFWNHVSGYWKASLEKPEKVLFLRYEDMLEDPASQFKKIALFMGFPFSLEEESQGVVQQLIELCSLGNLKKLDVNKHGKPIGAHVENKDYFRKGEIGDWVNHLSPSMVEKIEKVIQEKLGDSGLTFKYKI